MLLIFKILKFLIDSRLFISIAAVGLSLSSLRIVGLDWNANVVILVFCSTIVAYTFPLYLKLVRYSTRWNVASAAYFFAFLLNLYLLSTTQVKFSIALYVGLCLCTLLYYIPFGSWGSLREIGFVKMFVIALCWTLATVTLPLSYLGVSTFDNRVAWLMIERFLFILAITIPFDVRDVKIDKQGGLITLPVVYGMKKALLTSATLLMVYLIVTVFHYGFGNIVFVRAICVFFVLIVIQKINLSRSSYYYNGFFDGSLILQSILLHLMI